MSDELKERNILKLTLIVKFACATIDVGHPIFFTSRIPEIFVQLFRENQFAEMPERSKWSTAE
jgi:hypothetical protein